jgi:mRNA interferase HigB
VRIISRNTLVQIIEDFEGHEGYSALKTSLEASYHAVKRASWKNSSDVKNTFAHASIVSADRVVFNIRGNNYRLVVYVDYRRSAVFMKWLGTHKEYDAIDVRTVQHEPEAH